MADKSLKVKSLNPLTAKRQKEKPITFKLNQTTLFTNLLTYLYPHKPTKTAKWSN
jgi:hypothetical protein